MISRWGRVRMVLCGLAFSALIAMVARRAWHLQIEQAEELRGKAEDQYLQQIEVRPQRGRVLDRNDQELAATAQFDSVFCNPRQLLALPDGPKRLAEALHLDGRTLRRQLEGKRYFAYVKRTVSIEESARVKALALPGVGLRKEPKRIYPGNELGATVIGHANIDGIGVEGVELAFDQHLRGEAQTMHGMIDGSGRELWLDGLGDRTSSAGKDLVLSLDRYLVYVTEKALGAAVDKWHAKGGVAVMMDPRTGDILALANAPTYDPNDPKDLRIREARNRAITDTYEPGSTMKTFTFAAALDAGKVRPTDYFDCQMGSMQVGKYRIRDTHPIGTVTAAEVYQQSSNIGTVKIARRLGREALYDALTRFGFGHATGIGLPGERQGRLRPVSVWGDIGFANVAFGQGLTVTPLQMTAGFAAVASGGIYRAPRLALRTISPDGKVEAIAPPANSRHEQRVISEKAAATLLSIMQLVTQGKGSGKKAAIDGYPVAGKTGTAQKVSHGHYDPEKWIASFIGIVPADKPRVVIAVIIDEPKPNPALDCISYRCVVGGNVAAPAWKEIAEATLKYLSVPPSLPMVAEKEKPGAVKPAATAGAAEAVTMGEGLGSDLPTWEGLEELDQAASATVVEGAEGAVAEATEDATASEGGSSEDEGESPNADAAAARAEQVRLPSFVGMSLGEAIRAARRAGIEIAPEGSGVAVAQSPGAGPARRGAICRVSFRPGG
jgi:cell division protein FtsI (penicillin-binding protein 3)